MWPSSLPSPKRLTTEATSSGALLHWATRRLASQEFSRLTAEVLLAHLLGQERTTVMAHPEMSVAAETRAEFVRGVERLAAGEPLAYLLGRREFWGLDFFVDARVLTPRPETELLVERALDWGRQRPAPLRFVDVGVGSGCIAVTLAVHWPIARGIAIDISAEALTVARFNAARHRVSDQLQWIQGDLLASLAPATCDLVIANLPYVPSAELASLPCARYEPRLALDGGDDGLELIRRLLFQAPRVVTPHGGVLLEIGEKQGAAAAALAHAAFPSAHISVLPDWAGCDRLLSVLPGEAARCP